MGSTGTRGLHHSRLRELCRPHAFCRAFRCLQGSARRMVAHYHCTHTARGRPPHRIEPRERLHRLKPHVVQDPARAHGALPRRSKRRRELLCRIHRPERLPRPRVLYLRVCSHRLPCRHRVPAHAQGNPRNAPTLRTPVRRGLARRIPRARRKRRHSRPRLRLHRGRHLRAHPTKKDAPLGNAYYTCRPRMGRYLFRLFALSA